MSALFIVLLSAIIAVNGQMLPQAFVDPNKSELPTNLHNGLTEKIGNFSIELLYHTSMSNHNNLIVSPITVWTLLALLSEGAAGNTAREINNAIRVSSKQANATKSEFTEIYKWLQVNTSTVQLAKINAMFIDDGRQLQIDFKNLAHDVYKAEIVSFNFTNAGQFADVVNNAVSKYTHGRISSIVNADDLQSSSMVLTSALYFKGQWTVPFNASSTEKSPFFNSSGHKIGEVNMMYSKSNYPFANIQELEARVIELPYGKENRLSMLIMVPNRGVSLAKMFENFARVPLDTVFNELKRSQDEYSDDETDCYIPRFKIQSNLDLTHILQERFGIFDLFSESDARLPYLARTPVYVKKVIHKAEIEVTEEGTTATGVTAAVVSNRIGSVQFSANKPFCYMIIEKVTNSIVFGGLYEVPSLY